MVEINTAYAAASVSNSIYSEAGTDGYKAAEEALYQAGTIATRALASAGSIPKRIVYTSR